MIQKLDDVELRNKLHCVSLEFLPKIQEYVVNNQEKLGLQDYSLDFDCNYVKTINEYGGYYDTALPFLVQEPQELVDMITASISNLSNLVLRACLNIIPRNKYKTAITHAMRYFTHVVPSTEILEKLKQEAEYDSVYIDPLAKLIPERYGSVYLKCGYVYGIVAEGELVYIGKTERPLLQRIQEHKKEIAAGITDEKYQYLHNCKEIQFVLLFDGCGKATAEQLCYIEKTFIEFFQPKLNKEGVTTPYVFQKHGDKYSTYTCNFGFERKIQRVESLFDGFKDEFMKAVKGED